VLQAIRRLLTRPECFRLEREFAGPGFHRGEQCTLARHTQHLHRTAVAQPEVRRHLHQGLRLGPEARRGIGGWLSFYNDERLHQALGYRTPCEVFRASATYGYVDNASALTTSPQAHHQQQERDSIELEKVL
jgi:hypothetical protein